MYQALLTNRYLTTRVIPLIAVAAVALCVALVIIVVSVMTGFLNMVKDSGKTLMGDVVVHYQLRGIPNYERLMQRINALPEAAASTPVVDSWGLLRMPYPYGSNKETETVQIWGIEPITFAQVTGYEDTLHWRELTDDQWQDLFSLVMTDHWQTLADSLNDQQREALFLDTLDEEQQESFRKMTEADRRHLLAGFGSDEWHDLIWRLVDHPERLQETLGEGTWQTLLALDDRLVRRDQILEDAQTLRRKDDGNTIVLGMHVSRANERQKDGSYAPMNNGHWWMPKFEVTLTTLPVDTKGGIAEKPVSRILQVVNEFVSGVFLIDDKRVMVPLSIAQDMTGLNEADLVDWDQVDERGLPRVIGIDPAKATMILVRGNDGVAPEELRDRVRDAYDAFAEELWADESVLIKPPDTALGVSIVTWEEQQAQIIGPVEKERELMRTLFSLVYLVCAGLVLAIFWAIVYEKTRDIGILRSIGASRIGILWIFLRYGLVVGVLGAIMGFGLGFLVVHNINSIHSAMGDPPWWLGVGLAVFALAALAVTLVRSIGGRLLPLVLGTIITLTLVLLSALILILRQSGGIVIWDPQVYYFTVIPNDVDMGSAAITMIGAVVFSLIGAFIPAAKAADTDPVQALRYE